MKPEWANLPKRPCDNCGKRYKPTRPNSHYHSEECKRAFHRHGGAYIKLKAQIGKEIQKQMNLTETCADCKGKTHVIGKGNQRGQRLPCPNLQCIGGEQLTAYGQRLLTTLRRFLVVNVEPAVEAFSMTAGRTPANGA